MLSAFWQVMQMGAVLNDIYENQSIPNDPPSDQYCLAAIKHYRSLIPMGQEQRKPIFKLTSADGAIGSHANAVKTAKKDFETLAVRISEQAGILPPNMYQND